MKQRGQQRERSVSHPLNNDYNRGGNHKGGNKIKYNKGVQSFAVALRMAWANAKAHIAAKAKAGITEETHTWSGWKELGYEVIHESKALYKAIITNPATKSGTRVACYFGASQVQPIGA